MARLPTCTPTPPRERFDEKLRDEYDAGLDKTGPRWESEDEEQEAVVRAAGVSAYYEGDA